LTESADAWAAQGLPQVDACAAGSDAAPDARLATSDAPIVDAVPDSPTTDAAATCELGSNDRPAALIMGQIGFFAGGASLPAGHYRVTYADGCMKYASFQGWALNAYADASDGWWLVGATTSIRYLILPGTVGYELGAGGFDTFDACVLANHKLPPIDFEFLGGPLGAWLEDTPYYDNLPGPNGRSPSWRLTYLDGPCSVVGAPAP
jgi:hypothetical protein